MSEIKNRAEVLGEYIVNEEATVRAAAKVFKISKSTVHKDVTVTLKGSSPALWQEVRRVLEKNKQERHIRGGRATKEKYSKIRD